MADIISEYEAASITFMSPPLLRWLTSYAPKSNSTRKLRVHRKDASNDCYYYDRDEVVAFDAFLKAPWPAKDGKRPGIPSQIRKEIKTEANGECAICNHHGDTCEAAHLEPVAKTYNNHPENLLWLCANHHTSFDQGFYKPVAEEAEFVSGFKLSLRRFRVMQWRMQASLNVKLFAVLENCDRLAQQLENATTTEQVNAIEAIANSTLKLLPTLAPTSKSDPTYPGYEAISGTILGLANSAEPIKARLARTTTARAKFIEVQGLQQCPLCSGSGSYDRSDCPVCDGEREIEPRLLSRIDLDDYALVNCPICHGSGTHHGEQCPACDAEGKMQKRFYQRIDSRDYEQVICPICHGSRRLHNDECPGCGGEGSLLGRNADKLDPWDYQLVPCRVCHGQGERDGDECPLCNGEGHLRRDLAAQVDENDYEQVECPVCEGTRKLRGDDCPPCQGEGRMERRQRDLVDKRDYELVDCPVCENEWGKRDECPACRGEGRMERRFQRNIDRRDYL